MPTQPTRVCNVIAILAALVSTLMGSASLSGAVIPPTDSNVLAGLSPYNWVCKAGYIDATVNGSSIAVQFKGTRRVALQIETSQFKETAATRFPIIAWSVNGGQLQTHQLTAGQTTVPLSTDVGDPIIDLYIKGTSPFENRFAGDIPPNSLKITGFVVDDGASTAKVVLPDKVWLNIGDSIMSGDGAAYAKGQGRPPDDVWAASEDGRACYGYLLAKHYGYREARIAYGGYDWGGGSVVPPLATLIDKKTSTVSRLEAEALSPCPDVVLINLGENGPPASKQVTDALAELRRRVKPATKIIVMIPVSGQARAQVTAAFNEYKKTSKDEAAYLVDLGPLKFATCDGQHPTAEGHQAIYSAALPAFDALVDHPTAGK